VDATSANVAMPMEKMGARSIDRIIARVRAVQRRASRTTRNPTSNLLPGPAAWVMRVQIIGV
jgi:hypothetical protein